MTLLDAYALIAFLIGGPAAPQVRLILRERDAAITTTNLIEVLDVSQRLRGLSIARTMEVLGPLFDGSLTAISLDLPCARRAAEIRARHYRRSTCPISLADAVLLAQAGATDRIATSDSHILAIAREEGIDTLALPEQG